MLSEVQVNEKEDRVNSLVHIHTRTHINTHSNSAGPYVSHSYFIFPSSSYLDLLHQAYLDNRHLESLKTKSMCEDGDIKNGRNTDF